MSGTSAGAMPPAGTAAGADGGALAADSEEAGRAADAAAGAWLMCAVGTGAVLALLHELSGNGVFRPLWAPVDLSAVLPGALYPLRVILPLLVPALLIFCAYFFVARLESSLNARRQRGALALLGFAALFMSLLLGSVTFSGVYGMALLALAVRTRDTLTSATGVMALAAYAWTSFVPIGWEVLPVLCFMAVAAFSGAWRVGKGYRASAAVHGVG
ncbi:hypothetical protein [Arthrobacter sp. 7Tela_A1]|uniref:hypothetical protein n=1 Tax=Arthrobacter sp. 7Tela_A1 TaxID=3093745 RepID=UPI003BB4AAF0